MGLLISSQCLQPYLPIAQTVIPALFSGGLNALTCRIWTFISPPWTGGIYGIISSLVYRVLDAAWTKFVHPSNPIMDFKLPVCFLGSLILGCVASSWLGFSITYDVALVLTIMNVALGIIIGITAGTILLAALAIKAHIDGTTIGEAVYNFLESTSRSFLEALGFRDFETLIGEIVRMSEPTQNLEEVQ